MSRRAWWITVFLGVTGLAVALELWASFDNAAWTTPWTYLIVDTIPAEVTFAVIGALCLWLPIHFGIRYWRKNKADKENAEDETEREDATTG